MIAGLAGERDEAGAGMALAVLLAVSGGAGDRGGGSAVVVWRGRRAVGEVLSSRPTWCGESL